MLNALFIAAQAELPKIVSASILLGLTWAVGNRVAARWNLYQKQWELDRSAARDFQLLYGEFFALWKMWNFVYRSPETDSDRSARRWEVLKRASDAEGKLESLLVRLSCDPELANDEVAALGIFRQLYQTLRESIRDNKVLSWTSSEHPEYAQFKRFAAQIALLILRDPRLKADAEVAARHLIEITANQWESQRAAQPKAQITAPREANNALHEPTIY